MSRSVMSTMGKTRCLNIGSLGKLAKSLAAVSITLLGIKEGPYQDRPLLYPFRL